jgi:hypothetical protein
VSWCDCHQVDRAASKGRKVRRSFPPGECSTFKHMPFIQTHAADEHAAAQMGACRVSDSDTGSNAAIRTNHTCLRPDQDPCPMCAESSLGCVVVCQVRYTVQEQLVNFMAPVRPTLLVQPPPSNASTSPFGGLLCHTRKALGLVCGHQYDRCRVNAPLVCAVRRWRSRATRIKMGECSKAAFS